MVNRNSSIFRSSYLLRAVLLLMAASLYQPRTINAQEGGVMLTHFTEIRQAEDQNWSIIQDSRNIMLFANRRGVATFDGYNWDLLRLPVIPYTMVYDSIGERVFIGGENGYGILSRTDDGIYLYEPIEIDTAFTGIVSGMVITDSLIYVLTNTCLVTHRYDDLEQTSFIVSGQEEPFTSIFTAPSGVFVSIWSQGLFRLEGSELIPLITGYMTAWDDILFALPYDDTQILLGLGSNIIHLFDGLEFYNWTLLDEGYLDQKLLAGGHVINDSLYLLSTLEGGVIVAGRKSRRVYHKINYERGLPDNEVFAVGSDENSGLWISHQFGLTRADLGLPVSNFSIYQGLKGNLISATWHNGRLYAGTSDGLYLLSEVRRYEVTEVLSRVPVNRRVQVAPVDSLKMETVFSGQVLEQQTVVPARRTIFDMIFGKKIREPVKDEATRSTGVPVTKAGGATGEVEPASKRSEEATPGYRYERRTISRLSSVKHEYRRVNGLEGKCRQIVGTMQGLLAATNRGLFNVSDSNAVPLVTGRYINHIGNQTVDGRYFVATNNGYFSVFYDEGKWKADIPFPSVNRAFYSSAVDNEGNLWLGAENSLVLIRDTGQSGSGTYEYKVDSDHIQRYHVEYVRDTIFAFTELGIYFYDEENDRLVAIAESPVESSIANKYIFTEPGRPWVLKGGFPVYFGAGGGWTEEEQSLLRLFEGIVSISTSGRTLWITDTFNRIIRVEPENLKRSVQGLELFIGGISGTDEPFIGIDRTEFARGQRVVQLSLISPYYVNQNAVQYRYMIQGLTDGWTEWSSSPTMTLFPRSGNYTLRVMARALTGVESEEKILQFRIRPKVTETGWFYFIAAFMVFTGVFVMMRMREKKLINDKNLLEAKVAERTSRIAAQKQEITSSIEYASRIQHAMLPADQILRDTFADHFILFRPRNIVSGDFYWIAREGGRVFFTAADCTGHGVPGAFMSMLGISSLNEIINSDTTLSAAEVLDLLKERVIKSLKQTGRQGEAADGIDMALCIFDHRSRTIEFSAAYNSLVHFRASKLTEYRGDRMPIGIFYGEKKDFMNHIIKLDKGDTMYLFTDGFADQFGGPDHSKYKTKNLKLLLSSIKELPMIEQKRALEEEFDRWRDGGEQVDDVTIIGIRV